MARYSVGIVGLGGPNPHVRCFEDFARGLASALRTLGHEVVSAGDPDPGRLIMFGANNVTDPNRKIPRDAIVYNPEQVASAVGAFLMQNREQFKDHVVWDYSAANAAALRSMGMKRVVLCPVGFVPSMRVISKIPPEEETIDVLHYGSTNERRRAVLDALSKSGLKVVRLYGIYGEPRDREIARSKVVLNMHFYDRPVHEIFRVSHLLANGRCVVSEGGGCDQGLEDFAARSTRLVPYEKLVEACREMVADRAAREAQAARGRAAFEEIDLVESVRRALEESVV